MKTAFTGGVGRKEDGTARGQTESCAVMFLNTPGVASHALQISAACG
jgi:hypothetical protein